MGYLPAPPPPPEIGSKKEREAMRVANKLGLVGYIDRLCAQLDQDTLTGEGLNESVRKQYDSNHSKQRLERIQRQQRAPEPLTEAQINYELLRLENELQDLTIWQKLTRLWPWNKTTSNTGAR